MPGILIGNSVHLSCNIYVCMYVLKPQNQKARGLIHKAESHHLSLMSALLPSFGVFPLVLYFTPRRPYIAFE